MSSRNLIIQVQLASVSPQHVVLHLPTLLSIPRQALPLWGQDSCQQISHDIFSATPTKICFRKDSPTHPKFPQWLLLARTGSYDCPESNTEARGMCTIMWLYNNVVHNHVRQWWLQLELCSHPWIWEHCQPHQEAGKGGSSKEKFWYLKKVLSELHVCPTRWLYFS